jgi:hypothetical protein
LIAIIDNPYKALIKGKIMYKHHAYTFSHYSNCVCTGVGLDHNLICNNYMLKIEHNNTIVSIILHKVKTK